MTGTHRGAGRGKRRNSACHRTAQVVFGITVAAGKLRAAQSEDSLGLSRWHALREERAGDPQIHDAPVRAGKALLNVPSAHPRLVDLDGLGRGDRRWCSTVRNRGAVGLDAGTRCPGLLRYPLSGGVQQGFRVACQTGPAVHDPHPGSVAARCAPLRLLIRKARQSAQVSPVGTGPISTIGKGQLLADGGGDGGLQGSGTDMNPGLQMAGAGLQHHARFMPAGLHRGDHRRIGVVQVDEDVAGISVLGKRLNEYVTSLAVAGAQKSYGCQTRQLVCRPQPFPWEWSLGAVVNHPNEVEFVRHRRELPADGLRCESESAIKHAPNSAIVPGCRTMNFQRAVSSVLTDCLSRGVHPKMSLKLLSQRLRSSFEKNRPNILRVKSNT